VVRTLNLGILAHVDAGKTSLTERLLFEGGVIAEVGSVDAGSTQTDSLALERKRGITIKSAVVSFVVEGVTVNLIDTPGHPDFIAEVERVLGVLDGAVLVVSAVEGVQAQTRVLMRTLQRLHIPTMLFVNKIDRSGADLARVLGVIAERLSPAVVAMGSARDLGTRGAAVTPFGASEVPFRTALTGLLAEHDDALLTAYVEEERTVPYARLRAGLAAQTSQALVHPVFFGSAITGAGVAALIGGITELLPAEEGNAEGPVSGNVFKVDRGPAGEKIAYVRMFSGTLCVRDRLQLRGDHGAKVTAISVFEHGSSRQRRSVAAGRIARLWGLGDAQIGDRIGASRTAAESHYFPPPTLETVIVAARPADTGALHVALAQLAEQDPLINLRQDDVAQEMFVSLYGEVQKEVIRDTLAEEFGLEVSFRETTTICVERPSGTGAARETIGKEPNPFLATIGLRVEPAPTNSGISFRLEVELGSMPRAFFTAVEETVRETLNQGIYGWQVTDCTVTMTHAGYLARQSSAHGGFDKSMSSTSGDFRNLTPLVLLRALKQARTTVYEPIHRFHLELPTDLLGPVLPVLARLKAVSQTPELRGASCAVEGEIPAAQVHELQEQLPGLARGEGVLESAFDTYRPVRGPIPTRPRTDHNPINRKEYLLHVLRRV
jgi:ribosomal protection tetracycline resistance protein